MKYQNKDFQKGPLGKQEKKMETKNKLTQSHLRQWKNSSTIFNNKTFKPWNIIL